MSIFFNKDSYKRFYEVWSSVFSKQLWLTVKLQTQGWESLPYYAVKVKVYIYYMNIIYLYVI